MILNHQLPAGQGQGGSLCLMLSGSEQPLLGTLGQLLGQFLS